MRKGKSSPRKKASSVQMRRCETASGLPLLQVYTHPRNSNRPSEHPGKYPFTRGIHETMYRERLWTFRQYAGFGSAREANARFHYLLSKGGSGLSVAFDLPTQMGLDPDSELAAAEVGKVGVSIASVLDMETLVRSIPLDKVSISMTINATAPILLAMLLVAAKRQKISWRALRGTTQNDILKEYIARGTYIYPPASGMKLATDLIEFCSNYVPEWNTTSISGYHIREAGSTAIQEVAFTLANAKCYVEAALERGLRIDSFAPRLAFFFNCHNDFFEEIAKFRAARALWAEIMKKKYGAKDPRSQMLRFHTQTAGSSLTAQQPLNNVVRTSLQALAAVLGGTQSLHTNAYDEALSLPTPESAVLALRTQQIIAFESGVPMVADPLGGSYLVETLTGEIQRSVRSYLRKIDSLGGMLGAISSNYPQHEIEAAAFQYQKRVEVGEAKVVGVNSYQDPESKDLSTVKVVKKLTNTNSTKDIRRLKRERASRPVSISLKKLKHAALAGKNLMPSIIEAVESFATIGEISDVLRELWGQYHT